MPDPAVFASICQELAEGRSLRAICAAEGMPSRETVRKWLRDNPELVGQYVRAREDQAEHYADEIVEIVDTEQDANRARVRVDARKWVVSKLLPKKYGDRTTQVVEGGDKPVEVTSDMEMARWMALMLTKAADKA